MKTYKDIYQGPYKLRIASHVWDAKQNFVFQFEYRWTDKGDFEPEFKKLTEDIIEVLNGNKSFEGKHIFKRDAIYIFMDNDPEPIITIRGWGGLTGIGGHKLSFEDAANIQMTFGDFLIDKLNGKL